MNGFCSTLAWISIWPMEIAKNHIQSQDDNNLSSFKIIKKEFVEKGIRGLFRGCIPGLSGVFIRSGFSMIVMLYTQKFLTYIGFRNN